MRPVREEQVLARRRTHHLHAGSLELDLRPEHLRSTVELELTLTGTTCELDFAGTRVEATSVDGRSVASTWDGSLLSLPVEPGRRTIAVTGRFATQRWAVGMHEERDADGRYLHTHFEPAHARRVFACLDDPAVRVPWMVSARSDDLVLGGMPVVSRAEGRTSFATSPPLPAYLLAVAAGPWSGTVRQHRGLPIGVWARRGLWSRVDVDDLLDLLTRGVDLMEERYGTPFPYPKLDVVFVPGARYCMENAGLITFTETGLPEGGVTPPQARERADVLLHELAHMWFGNLLGIRWWDDLWLKEAFATREGVRAAEALLGSVPDAGARFAVYYRRRALGLDQGPALHPVRQPVRDTDAAADAVDGITYGKGATALEQLERSCGSDALRGAVRALAERRPHEALTLHDLLDELPEQARSWDRTWLRGTGVASARVTYEAEAAVVCATGGPPQSVDIVLLPGRSATVELPGTVRLPASQLCLVDSTATAHVQQLFGPLELERWELLWQAPPTARAVAWTHLERSALHGQVSAAQVLTAVRTSQLLSEEPVTAGFVLDLAVRALLRWCPVVELERQRRMTTEWLLDDLGEAAHPARDRALLAAARIAPVDLLDAVSRSAGGPASRHQQVAGSRRECVGSDARAHRQAVEALALLCDLQAPVADARRVPNEQLHREHDEAVSGVLHDAVRQLVAAADDPVHGERLTLLLHVLPPTAQAVQVAQGSVGACRSHVAGLLEERIEELRQELALREGTS